MKYIIVECQGHEVPIIFDDLIQHADLAGKFQKVISAGFIDLYGTEKPLPHSSCLENAIEVNAFGESVSLQIKSRLKDKEMIHKSIHRHYH